MIVLTGESDENRETSVVDLSLGGGGLWLVTEDIEKVFVIVQKYFAVQTADAGMRVINIPSLVDDLVKFPPLYLTYEQMGAEKNITDKKVIVNVLSSILHLFLKVRTFSHVKVITAKHKKDAAMKRSLRKTLKLTSVGELIYTCIV